MKIAHVDAETGFSGGEVQVFTLIEGLRRAGWSNVLFAPPGSRCQARAKELGVEFGAVVMRNDLDAAAVLELKRGFERSGAALAHLHTGRATWLGGWAARIAGIPALTTRRMDREVKPGMRTKIVHETLTRRTVAISPAVAECLRAGGVPSERVRTIASAVDPAQLRAKRGRDDVRRELGVADERVVLLTSGALVRRKGLDVLLDALAQAAFASAAWSLWIAGDGAEREALEQRARELTLEGNVHFLGRRDDIPELLNACDAVVMPSRREGLGVAALEAMAACRAVVATKVGGLASTVVDGETGLLVAADDASALALALRRVVADAALRKRLGEAGRARLSQGFLAEQMVDAYAALYREVLAEAQR